VRSVRIWQSQGEEGQDLTRSRRGGSRSGMVKAWLGQGEVGQDLAWSR
jgi:hypothetical protein